MCSVSVARAQTQGLNDTQRANSSVAQLQSQGPHANLGQTQEFYRIRCCDILNALNTYLIRSNGDTLPFSKCQEQEHECLSLKLIDIFFNHVRVLLNSSSGVSKDETHILISKDLISQKTATLFVLAFLGGSVPSEHELLDEHLSLEYDSTLERMSLRDSACAVNKTVYSTIVLASIALVVFFIAMQVIEVEKEKSTSGLHNSATTVMPGRTQTAVFPDKNLELMMRLR